MKRTRKFAAVSMMVFLMGAGLPAVAAQDGGRFHERGGMHWQSADHRGDREWNEAWNQNFRSEDRWDHDRRDYGRREYRESGPVGYSYAPEPEYAPAPVYTGPVYDDGYHYGQTHNGRTAAIIGGSAAAGALIGAAAGHGSGAIVGAVIGGIAGAAVSSATDHHAHY